MYHGARKMAEEEKEFTKIALFATINLLRGRDTKGDHLCIVLFLVKAEQELKKAQI
jgi:hypothetical protein